MKFCPKCSSLLIPAGSELVCKSCGHKETGEVNVFRDIKKDKKKLAVEQGHSDVDTLPTMKKPCPKCQHGEAFFWTLQTRSADESETEFFRCKKCGYSWRKY
ncbi:MAG: transcription factor S [archaeon]